MTKYLIASLKAQSKHYWELRNQTNDYRLILDYTLTIKRFAKAVEYLTNER